LKEKSRRYIGRISVSFVVSKVVLLVLVHFPSQLRASHMTSLKDPKQSIC
jgi:hypothetical protein